MKPKLFPSGDRKEWTRVQFHVRGIGWDAGGRPGPCPAAVAAVHPHTPWVGAISEPQDEEN